MARSSSIQLDSFELTLSEMENADLDALHALSLAVGWPHRAEDWQIVREMGRGVVARDAIGRVLGSAMWFDFAPDFTTIGMVITSPRLQMLGTGRWMMEHVLAQTGSRALGLNSTRAAKRLYQSLGFRAEKLDYQCNGEAISPPVVPLPPRTRLRALDQADLAEIAALDLAAYGAGRMPVLARLLNVSKGMALIRDGRIVAYSLCRRFGRGHVIGPVAATSDEEAIAVIRPHVADHAGSFLRIDTRQQTGAFPQFLAQSGLSVYDTVTSMSMRRAWLQGDGAQPSGGGPLIYGLASQALG
ncbi:GNAT family N-acetyltransferase [Rhizobium leucaenae]|uniref:GNAT superfamily N-acetyltransferase n=1 Tax=Rhizobium leucaenae TaxID=29450 RepID=A0A7W6ZV18_9HYPH|nr:GNAT family N-acetyltransferase [Rhizobium leucaenae]MBB4568737.1 GNAT superfamily N-acetyltransferase [Rhizobium leucaenae]MBB6302185.1 GNAT superfamily N-acetyltransferase [Rhizobium leucaenae]